MAFYPGIPSCYVKQNNTVSKTGASVPCGLNSTQHPFVSCCWPGDVCLSENLCYFQHIQANGSGYYSASCTDPTYEDPSCFQHCVDISWGDVFYNKAFNQWSCCGVDSNGDANCLNQTSRERWTGPEPVALTTLTSLPSSNSYIFDYLTASNIGTYSTRMVQVSTFVAITVPEQRYPGATIISVPVVQQIATTITTTAAMSTTIMTTTVPASTITKIATSTALPRAAISTGAAAGIGGGVTLLAIIVLQATVWFLCVRSGARKHAQLRAFKHVSAPLFPDHQMMSTSTVRSRPLELEDYRSAQEVEGHRNAHELGDYRVSQ